MKQAWIEMLLTLFEKSLIELKHNFTEKTENKPMMLTKESSIKATRVMTREEQIKLTKPAQQFLAKLRTNRLIKGDTLDLIINQLMLSHSDYVSVNETKWTIRDTLSEGLTDKELAVLDFILLEKDHHLPLH